MSIRISLSIFNRKDQWFRFVCIGRCIPDSLIFAVSIEIDQISDCLEPDTAACIISMLFNAVVIFSIITNFQLSSQIPLHSVAKIHQRIRAPVAIDIPGRKIVCAVVIPIPTPFCEVR